MFFDVDISLNICLAVNSILSEGSVSQILDLGLSFEGLLKIII